MDDNDFELNILPFLKLQSIFNVELLQTYFSPLLDNSEVENNLSTTNQNFDNNEQAIMA